VQKAPYLNTEYLGFQLDSTNLTGEQAAQGRALRDRRVRQALNYAINKPELTAYVLNHVGVPGTSGFVPAALPSFSPTKVPGYTCQPQQARQLLASAGYGPSRPLRLRLSTVAERKAVAEYLQKNWADVGVQVQIDINQAATQQELVDNGRAAFFSKSWLGDPTPRTISRSFTALISAPVAPIRRTLNRPLTTRFTTRPAVSRTPPGARPCTRKWTACW
jgi:peptide/nickel transport system substrate-binding protein